MAVRELPKEQQELIEEIARFRSGLEPLERQILDAVVHEACEPSGQQAARRPAGAPSEAEVARLVAKIETFEQTLPDVQRRLFDEILTKGSHEEMDVEAHRQLLWRAYGMIGPAFWLSYDWQCNADGGAYIEYQPDWWSGGLQGWYRCWTW